MTTQQPARPVFATRNIVYLILGAALVAAAFAAGRYERDQAPQPLTGSAASSSALTPSRGVQSVLTAAEVIAEHEAQITGVSGLPPFTAQPAVGGSEAEVLAQHATEINGVFGDSRIGTNESAEVITVAEDGWSDARPIP